MKKNISKKIKKSLKNFLKDESGAMTKENVLKISIGTIAALSMLSGLAKATIPACDGKITHTSDNTVQWINANGLTTPDGVKTLVPSHTHHAAHCSY